MCKIDCSGGCRDCAPDEHELAPAKWTKDCKKLAAHFGWVWDGHSALAADPTPTAMFHTGHWPLVLPMELVQLAVKAIPKQELCIFCKDEYYTSSENIFQCKRFKGQRS